MGDEEVRKLRRELRQLYDDYRSSLLNVKYYSARFVRYKRFNFWMEIFLAVTSSSAMATLTLWKTGMGEVVWMVLGALTTLVAVVKPILQLPKSSERYQGLHGSYRNLYFDLESVVQEVTIEHALNQTHRGVWDSAKKRLRELAPQEDTEAELDRGQIAKYAAEVNREIPMDSLWIPQEGAA
jgi:hypothetical protein